MSKMSELSQVLDEMVSCGENLIQAANITVKAIMIQQPMKHYLALKGKRELQDIVRLYISVPHILTAALTLTLKMHGNTAVLQWTGTVCRLLPTFISRSLWTILFPKSVKLQSS